MDEMTPAQAKRALRRGCTNKDVRKVAIAAADRATKIVASRSGMIFYGTRGSASVHYTVSDSRAHKNLAKAFERAGI